MPDRTARIPARGLRRLSLAVLGTALLALPACSRSSDPAHYVPLLATPVPEVRDRAIDELGRMQEKALPFMEQAVLDASPITRTGALRVLGKVTRVESLLLASPLVNDPEPAVRLAAVETVSSLASVWKERAAEVLVSALDGQNPDIVKRAAQGLKDMEYEAATDALRQRLDAGTGIQAVHAARYLYEVEPSEEVSSRLLAYLLSGEATLRDAAVADVRELKDAIVPDLVAFVQANPNSRVARDVLATIRDDLNTELGETLDRRRATEIIIALGTVADLPSVETLVREMNDSRRESGWRMAAAEALADAALSERATESLRRRVVTDLLATLEARQDDNRVPVSAAISLCRLRQAKGVNYLLGALATFKETTADQNVESMIGLRVRAQEALTASGEFVVPYLMQRAAKEDAAPVMLWACAKTFGELGVSDAVPLLDGWLNTARQPAIAVNPDGSLSAPAELADPSHPDKAAVDALRDSIEPFQQRDYVRWAAAMALGQIGGGQAERALQRAAAAERDLLARLRAGEKLRDYYKRAPVIEAVVRRHEDVLFYIRLALEHSGAAAPSA